MWLRKHATPGSASGGFTWDSPEHVVEVPEHVGEELLRIGGFEAAEAPTGAPQAPVEPEDDPVDEPDTLPVADEITEAPAAPKRRTRKPQAPEVAE